MKSLPALAILVASCQLLTAFPAAARTVLEGTWEGTFHCRGAATNVKIMMEPFRDHHTGVFIFPNEGGRQPSMNFTAFMGKNNSFQTKPGEWIGKPGRIGTFALKGTFSSDRRTIAGTINAPGCSDYEIRKIFPPS